MIPLKEHYKTTVVPELKDKLGLDSVMAVPKVTSNTKTEDRVAGLVTPAPPEAPGPPLDSLTDCDPNATPE